MLTMPAGRVAARCKSCACCTEETGKHQHDHMLLAGMRTALLNKQMAAHLWTRMSTGLSTMDTLLAAWQAVRGWSPVIITSWWLLSLSISRVGADSGLRGHCSTAKPPN